MFMMALSPLDEPSNSSFLCPGQGVVKEFKTQKKNCMSIVTLADDLIDFQVAKYTISQAHIKQANNSQRIKPGYSIPGLICSTLFL